MSVEATEHQVKWLSSVKAIDAGKVLSSNVQALLDELNEGDVDISKVRERLLLEPALTAKLLMIANSPFYGFHRQVQDIEEAIVVIGAVKLKTLVYSSLVLVSTQNADHQNFVLHSLISAHYTKLIAEFIGRRPEIAFTGALLHVLPILLNYQEDIHSIINMKVLRAACQTLLHQLQLPDPIVKATSNLYVNQEANIDTAIIRLAFNLSLIYLGKNQAPFKHLIDIEHDFSRLDITPAELAALFYKGKEEASQLIQLVGGT